ncbi:IS110 family transposase [Nannocystis exedens]|nr:IS110 family transposase [Nannocystis exedens]PCC68149.1 transposase [Nannocystis exedens]PCC68215.1 transposase [Nannocystis exedens]PCC72004.1 transposase [Nannocystis exedens]PCC75224.1 transposase [Nannocystis exedens]
MEVMYGTCAGMDVHKDSIVACVRCMKGNKVDREVRTFGTSTSELIGLGDWLEDRGCVIAVMEATGVYWKPVWAVLTGRVELVLANAHEVRNVPGRKTDMNDAMWLADLIAHGLVRASFVPPEPIADLRDLTRTRKQLSREVVEHTQRIQKVLETCNIKLASVASNILGKSGRAMLEAMVAGESDPEKLAGLARGTLKAKRGKLMEALHGRVRDHHRMLISTHLRLIDALQASIADVEKRIEAELRPFSEAVELLQTIPGVGTTAAQAIIAEVGVDMNRFRSAGHLRSWAGLCPRMDESAGKRRSNRMRKGNAWLKTMLIQCAWSSIRGEGYLRALFLRVRARQGKKKAIGAVAAAILTAVHGILRDHEPYRDLGAEHFNRNDRQRTASRLARRIRSLGYEVEMRPAA